MGSKEERVEATAGVDCVCMGGGGDGGDGEHKNKLRSGYYVHTLWVRLNRLRGGGRSGEARWSATSVGRCCCGLKRLTILPWSTSTTVSTSTCHSLKNKNMKTLRQIVTLMNLKVLGFPQHFWIKHHPQIPLPLIYPWCPLLLSLNVDAKDQLRQLP